MKYIKAKGFGRKIVSKDFDRLFVAIDGLADTNAFDPVWDLLNARLPELSVLVKKKMQERQDHAVKASQTIRRLVKGFDEFQMKYESELQFHEMSKAIKDVNPVNKSAYSDPQVVDDALRMLDEMGVFFDEYRHIQIEQPKTRSEHLENERIKRTIEEELILLLKKLVKLLGEEPIEKPLADTPGESVKETPPQPKSHEQEDVVPSVDIQLTQETVLDSDVAAVDQPMESSKQISVIERVEDDDFRLEKILKHDRLDSLPIQSCVWKEFAKGSFANAYWLSYGIVPGGSAATITDVLFACAMQQWLGAERSQNESDLVLEFAEVLSRRLTPVEDLKVFGLSKGEAATLVAAAAAKASLFEPDTGALAWLQRASLESFPFERSIRYISDFLTVSGWMDLGSLTARPDVDSFKQNINDVRGEAEGWLATAKGLRLGFYPATRVLKYLTNPKGPVGAVMQAICDGSKTEHGSLFSELPVTGRDCDIVIEQGLRYVGTKPGIR